MEKYIIKIKSQKKRKENHCKCFQIRKEEVKLSLFANPKDSTKPWLVWLSGLSTGLRAKGSLVQFPVRAHAWVAGQVPRWGT